MATGFAAARGKRRLRRALWAAMAGALLLPASVWAHAFWLVPFAPAPAPGESVALDLRIGPRWPGASTPRLPDLVADFRVDDAIGRREVAGRTNGRPVGHFEARDAGAAIVSMQTNASTITLPGPEFQAYLHEEGLDAALQLRSDLSMTDAPAREDFTRAAKTLVFVGGASRGSARVLGLPFDLVPLTDPVAYPPGQPFRVKLLQAGQPAGQTRVAALPKDMPEGIVEARTTPDGEAVLTLPHGGLWTLYAVHIEPAPRPPADWNSIWASLTFAVPGAPR